MDNKEKEVEGINFTHPANLIATWFGIGKIPFAPGTFGSLFAFPLFIFSHYLLCLGKSESSFSYTYIGFLVILFFIGQWACNVYMQKTGKSDPGEIVIDEVLGQLIVWFSAFTALAPSLGIFDILYGSLAENSQQATVESLHELFATPTIISGYIIVLLPAYLGGFVLFRIFDIWKPWPIKWCDKNIKGGFGVMFDDVFAAVYASIALYVLIIVFVLLFVPAPEPQLLSPTEIIQ